MRATDWEQEREAFINQISPDAHFNRAMDGLPGVYFFVKNPRGQTLFCRSNLPHNHGLPEESEVFGKTDFDLTPGPLADKYVANDAEVYEAANHCRR